MMALVSEEDGDFGAASALRMGGGLGARGALHSPSAAQAPSPPVLASLGASLSPPAAARGLASGSATLSLGCLASPPPPLAAGDGGGGDDDDADVCGDLQPRLLLLPAADDAAAGAAAAGGGYEPPHSRSVSAALGAALAMRLDLAAGAGDSSDGGADLGMRMPVSPVALCSVREGASSGGGDDGLSPAVLTSSSDGLTSPHFGLAAPAAAARAAVAVAPAVVPPQAAASSVSSAESGGGPLAAASDGELLPSSLLAPGGAAAAAAAAGGSGLAPPRSSSARLRTGSGSSKPWRSLRLDIGPAPLRSGDDALAAAAGADAGAGAGAGAAAGASPRFNPTRQRLRIGPRQPLIPVGAGSAFLPPPLPAAYAVLRGTVPIDVLHAAVSLDIPPADVGAAPLACLLPLPAEAPPRCGRPRKHPLGFDGLGNRTDQTVIKGVYRVNYKTGGTVWRVSIYFRGKNSYVGTYDSELTAIRAHDRKLYALVTEAQPPPPLLLPPPRNSGASAAAAAAAAAKDDAAENAAADTSSAVDALSRALILKVPGLDRVRPLAQQVDRLPLYLFAGWEEGQAADAVVAADGDDRGGSRSSRPARSCGVGALVGIDSLFRTCGASSMAGGSASTDEEDAAAGSTSPDAPSPLPAAPSPLPSSSAMDVVEGNGPAAPQPPSPDDDASRRRSKRQRST